MKVLSIGLIMMLVGHFVYFSADKLDDIVKKHIEVSGASLQAEFKSVYVEMETSQKGVKSSMKIYQKVPHCVRVEVKMGEIDVLTVFNGNEGWMRNSIISDIMPLPEDQVEQLKSQRVNESVLLNYKSKHAKYKGKKSIQGVDCYKIALIDDGKKMNVYLNRINHLLVATETDVLGDKVMSIVKSHEIIKGVFYPTNITTKMPSYDVVVLFKNYKINSDMNESLFAKPQKI